MKKTLLFLSLLTLTFLLISCTPPIPGGIDGGNTGGNISVSQSELSGKWELDFNYQQKASKVDAFTDNYYYLNLSPSSISNKMIASIDKVENNSPYYQIEFKQVSFNIFTDKLTMTFSAVFSDGSDSVNYTFEVEVNSVTKNNLTNKIESFSGTFKVVPAISDDTYVRYESGSFKATKQ
ncbi:hypothetical protein OF820_00520 [Oceanotoga sp. DSM 15011]|uniref:hypothetical protein n=1 Tax=Oceanotoga sp. DSM 15011 TaxID=2984951 RepID=UPI0021F42A22|nr:hypothetical protein [Oceanotoga sp. DSM 15011]UYP00180.1 hypothetical protein OF820_00520 [Oceanotoga sp. DSM 15011]